MGSPSEVTRPVLRSSCEGHPRGSFLGLIWLFEKFSGWTGSSGVERDVFYLQRRMIIMEWRADSIKEEALQDHLNLITKEGYEV